MAQMVLLLWFFMASLLFSSLVILLLMPSKYKPRSNCPAPRGMLNNTNKQAKDYKGKIKDKQAVSSGFKYMALRIHCKGAESSILATLQFENDHNIFEEVDELREVIYNLTSGSRC